MDRLQDPVLSSTELQQSCPTVKLYCGSWNCDILYVLMFLSILLNEIISTPDLPADLASVALTEQ